MIVVNPGSIDWLVGPIVFRIPRFVARTTHAPKRAGATPGTRLVPHLYFIEDNR